MTASRHRREVGRRTLALGSLLALCLAGGIFALGVAEGNALRITAMFVLAVAVGAGLLALDEARVVQARLQAELSRERAARTRASGSAHDTARALAGRIDQLESELAGVRRELARPPRSIVVVAQGVPAPSRAAARILEIADVVPAVWVGLGAGAPEGPPLQAPAIIDLTADVAEVADGGDARPSVDADVSSNDRPMSRDASDVADLDEGLGPDSDIDAHVDDFPVVEVVGEFSLEGLALFPRPAGMPTTFPSVAPSADGTEAGAVADAEPASATTAPSDEASDVIDLRERQRTNRSA